MKYASMQRRKLVIALSLGLFSVGAQALLSSPMGDAIPSGTGAGVHSPNSPFAPLPVRVDVLPWSMLTAIKTKVVKTGCYRFFLTRYKGCTKPSNAFRGS